MHARKIERESKEIMTRAHDARNVASRLIRLGIEGSRPRDPLQIIKLTYLSHGWMLGLYGRALSEQPVLAWKYGPVIPDVYHGLKRYGSSVIQAPGDFPEGTFDELEDDLIGQVSDLYSKFTGIQLSQLTHAVGTPWYIVWSERGQNSIIPNEMIQDHFAQLAESDE